MFRLDFGTPFGIPNEGNTCYINSVLQCLFSNKNFVTLALEHNQVQQCSRKLSLAWLCIAVFF